VPSPLLFATHQAPSRVPLPINIYVSLLKPEGEVPSECILRKRPYDSATDHFILDTDASDKSVGAELIQIQGGEERAVAYGSLTLTAPSRVPLPINIYVSLLKPEGEVPSECILRKRPYDSR
jgi:hypothetical protein